MSDAVLSQLLEAESQLSAQESNLSTQLNAIQEKRKGLQTVIEMFGSSSVDQGAAIATSTTAAENQTTSQAASSEAPTTKTRGRKASKPVKSQQDTSRRGNKAASSRQATTREKPSTPRRGPSGKSPNWQRYVQEPFRKTPLPDVVANILKAQPDESFKIAEIMEVIFKSDMPKAVFLKARNRVSNILSAGARSKEWNRGRGGRYSISAKSVK